MVSLGDIEGLRVAKAKCLSMNQTEYVVLVVKVMFIEVAVVSLNPIEPSTGRNDGTVFSTTQLRNSSTVSFPLHIGCESV